jgi:hypothetical protein
VQDLNLNINNLNKQLEELNIASNQMKSSLLEQLQNEKTGKFVKKNVLTWFLL